ncbi:hypothetical protein KBZ12_10285 [Cyanobium sp. Cruz CV13-4-11]|jgi:hypothetical protein|uniref:hypothetical protein n=1 Tax=unclassified Cyanobium TaxID=2627006 RepID=UPI0020CC80E6|nr:MULTISPECIES: hypothetical protein [unclassified Cyanobium]MCP9900816.1 hypothetical protein [Cyanobium sp. Cruz CV11-17]MCP9919862.1 hypothetical protein [Cyanobium sp. Cruz CV13-4-11]
MNDGLLLLLQQIDQLLLGAYVAADFAVGVVEEPDDGGLFGERGADDWNPKELVWLQSQSGRVDACRATHVLRLVDVNSKKSVKIFGIQLIGSLRPIDAVGRADETHLSSYAKSPHECPHCIDGDIAWSADFVANG